MPRISLAREVEAHRHIGAGRPRRLHEPWIVEPHVVFACQNPQGRRRIG